jgi:hypothetical protein
MGSIHLSHMSPSAFPGLYGLYLSMYCMHDKDAVTDPVTDDGSDRGVPQTKTGTRTVSDFVTGRYWAIYKYNQWQAKNVEGFSAITVLNEQQELTNRINAGWEQGHARPYPMRPQNTDDTLDSRHRPIWQMEVSCGRHQMEDQ